MLDPEDIQVIRDIIREEVSRLIPPKSSAAMRQKRYRDRLKERNALRNAHNERYASPSKNGVTSVTSDPLQRDLLMVPPTPSSLISQKKAKKTRAGPLMSNAALDELSSDPLYAGIDLEAEAIKFERWCKANKKLNTVRRFVNWINNPR